MKKLKVIIICLLAMKFLNAQQLPLFIYYQDGNTFTNPALIHSNYLINDLPYSVDLSYRYQWVEVEGAPKTLTGHFQHFNDDLNFLLGASIISDQTGPTGFNGIYFNGAYSIYINRDFQLSAGLSGGIVQYRVKGNELDFLEEGDIASQKVSRLYPDFGIGAVLYFKSRLYAGFSIPQLFGLDLNFKNNGDDFHLKQVRHYYTTVGGYIDFDDSRLQPSIWLKYIPNAAIHYDLILKYEMKEKFWLGGGGSSSGAMHLEAGFILDVGGYSNYRLLKAGYGYNYFFNTYGPDFGAAHELKISYSWGN